MRLTQIFLLLSGIGFMLIGINTFRDPIAAMAGVELGVQSINALNEVRANYGGMQIWHSPFWHTISLCFAGFVFNHGWFGRWSLSEHNA